MASLSPGKHEVKPNVFAISPKNIEKCTSQRDRLTFNTKIHRENDYFMIHLLQRITFSIGRELNPR